MTAAKPAPQHTGLLSGRRLVTAVSRRARLLAIVVVTVLLPLSSPGHAETASAAGLGTASDQSAWATELLGLLQGAGADELATAVSAAKTATALQAEALGGEPSPLLPGATHATPSAAAAALVAAHQVSLSPAQEAGLASLDKMPEPARSALTALIDAFSDFETATRAAYAEADLAALQQVVEELKHDPGSFSTESTGLADVLVGVGLDLRPVLSSRVALLDAAQAFNTAFTPSPRTTRATATGPVQVPGVLSVELDGTDTTYDYTGATVNGLVAAEDYVLLIDVGGNDTYRNNAGGGCGLCSIDGPPQPAVAALVDLSGHDGYVSGRPVGINGGGSFGAGFLLDAAGNDTYTAALGGTNGGGVAGSGLLVDGSGNDSYSAGDFATNGGAGLGTGLLVDAGGYDRYTAGNNGTNGGGVLALPLLIDAAGNDAYTALQSAVNGGGNAGPGFLLDASGTDAYTSTPGPGPDEGGGANGGGGGNPFGTGLLLDAGGDGDSYQDNEGGTGTDRLVVPKGSNAGAGAQIDAGDDISMSLALSPSSIPAGATSTATVTVTQVSTGRPLAGQVVRFNSDRTVGFSPATVLTNTSGQASVTVTGTGTEGTAAVTALADLSSAVASLTETAVSPLPSAPPDLTGVFRPLSSARIFEGDLGQGEQVHVQVAGSTKPDGSPSGVPATGASAVALNVTVSAPAGGGFADSFLTVWPTGKDKPTASNLNWLGADPAAANAVAVALGVEPCGVVTSCAGKVSIFNAWGRARVAVDVVGWYADASATSGARYQPLTPARILDSRTPVSCPSTAPPFGPTEARTVQVAGAGGVPATGVSAAVLNVTVAPNPCDAGATLPTGSLTVWPANEARPVGANLRYRAGQKLLSTLVVTKLSPDGKVTIANQADGAAHVVVDVQGWYSPETTVAGPGARLIPLTPARFLDTRNPLFLNLTGRSSPDKLMAPEIIDLQVTGQNEVPAEGVKAVVMNVTVTQPDADSYVVVWPTGTPIPLQSHTVPGQQVPAASTLNFVAGQTVPNLVIVPVGLDGKVSFYNAHGGTHVIADVVGWFAS